MVRYNMNNLDKTYLLWFAHEHVNFRKPEMDSIFKMFNIDIKSVKMHREHPHWTINSIPECTIRKIASRAVSLKFCLELWGSGNSHMELHDSLKAYPSAEIRKHTSKGQSFKINVETFCKHFSQAEKVAKIESFSYLPFEGPVSLNDPDTTLCFIEYYGLEPNDIPDKPHELFFGRWIVDGQRDLIRKFSLKSRNFIGNTSMDAQLSLIMANQAQIKKGDIVLDPFVGTGSLLVAASHWGGYTLGSDIDFLMLHGRTRPTRITQKTRAEGEGVAANMKQYGMSSYYVDVVVSDFSYPIWRTDMRFDAIITDPPYGIRESIERIGTAKLNPVIEEHQVSTHIPSKIVYSLNQIYKDLLMFSARHLNLNGRLVCWFPLFRDQYSDDQLPTHPCLELLANSEQVLSNYTSRRLLTYEKTKNPEESDAIANINLVDFRDKYFSLRDQSRKERRLRRAEERARQREDWEKSVKESTER